MHSTFHNTLILKISPKGFNGDDLFCMMVAYQFRMRRLTISNCYIMIFIISLSAPTLFAQDQPALPKFSFKGYEGVEITNELFMNDRPLIVIYFEPSCSHCKQQAEWLSNSMDNFEGVDLLWVAWEPTDLIDEFRDQYFPQAVNVNYAIDSDQEFDNIFGFSQIPTVFVYDDQNKLLKKFKKETKTEKLLKTLQSTR